MTKLVWAFLSILAGILMGLGLTTLATDKSPSFSIVTAGVWQARPKIGSPDADPYAKALMATRGEIPMGVAEGLTLTALKDQSEQPLNAGCTYRFTGPIPVARYWTVTAYDSKGGVPADPRLRASFTSAEVIRQENGQVELVFSPDPQPGNWIPLSGEGEVELVLRLYDAQVSTNAYALDQASVPKITREKCR